MSTLRKFAKATLLVILAISMTGCHMLKKDDDVERDWLGREIEIEYKTPTKVVAIWSNSVFNEPGEKPVRGLGGRVYFYDEHTPVQVEGKLSVFLYDDTDKQAEKRQEASKVVHFSPEQIVANYTPSEFGPSYSFWVPWGEVGGERKQLSVIPVFTDTNGQMLVGDQARHLLPGSDPIEFIDEEDGMIERASYSGDKSTDRDHRVVRASLTTDDGERRIYSTKIQLPATMQERLKKQPPKREVKRRGSWSVEKRTKSDYSSASSEPMKSGANSGLKPGQMETTTKSPKKSEPETAADSNPKVTQPAGSLRSELPVPFSPFSRR